MRVLALAVLAIAAASLAAPARAQTYSPDYPVCLHVYGEVTYYECRYSTLAQCAMMASGRSAQCVPNPNFASATRERRRHRTY